MFMALMEEFFDVITTFVETNSIGFGRLKQTLADQIGEERELLFDQFVEGSNQAERNGELSIGEQSMVKFEQVQIDRLKDHRKG